MQNGSNIEFAEKGVDAPAGGFILAYDSYFVNNIINVDITGYTDQHSILSRCVLQWDDELYDKGYNPAISLHLWNASGVRVYASHFANAASSGVSITDRGTGILADITDFTLKGLCTNIPYYTEYDRNSFENLNYAIKSNSGNNVMIDRSDFTENLRGAWIINSNAFQFTRNDLNVYDGNGGSFMANNSFGLYLEASTDYQVEENLFRDGRLGLIVYNSGAAENEIYLNDFENLTGNGGVYCSAVNMGINADDDNQRRNGLQYRCNLFSNTNKAIAVTGGLINTQTGGQIISDSYIKRTQCKDPITQTVIPANNLFWLHGDPMSDESDFFINDNFAAYPYKYNISSDNIPNYDADLNSFDYGFITPSGYFVFTTRTQECLSNLSGGHKLSFLTSSLNEKEEELDQSQTEYESLTAVQDETSLSVSAETAGITNMNDVHNNLIEASPYLTASVLNAYMMNDQISEMARANVLLANSPLPETVLENLPHSDIKEELQHYILQQQDGVNPLLAMQNHINGLKAAKQYLTDRLHIINMNSDDDEIITAWKQVLESKSDFHSKEKLVSLYKSIGDFEAAENLLANLETELVGSDKPEKLKQVCIAQIELNLRNQEASVSTNSADVDYLYSLADNYNHRSGSMARGILMAYGYETYDPVLVLPEEITDKSAAANTSTNKSLTRPEEPIDLDPVFNIFPNPVNDKLSVEFISMSESCDFVVYDMNGKIVQQITRNEALGYFVLNVSNLKSGNYILYSPQLSEKKQFVVKR
ncbi:MAG: T9SS type A sorting domain-containing protein [Bacteroidota bacterium]|nr:T9SS type A sorting domain-containing protein [Bacteroidota bacterium]